MVSPEKLLTVEEFWEQYADPIVPGFRVQIAELFPH